MYETIELIAAKYVLYTLVTSYVICILN